MDTNMYFRKAATGNLTATMTVQYLKVGPMKEPAYIEVIVPAIGEASDTLTPLITYTDTTSNEGGSDTLPAITAAGRYLYPIFTNKLYVGLTLTALDADSGGDMNFGAVVARIVPAGYDQQK